MKRTLTLIILACTLMIGSMAQAVTLSLIPQNQTIGLGNTASFSLLLSGLDQGTGLGGFDIDVQYDPAILDYNGDLAIVGNYVDFSSHVPGTLNLLGLAPSFVTPSELATFSFTGIAHGTSIVDLFVNDLIGDIILTNPETGENEIVSFFITDIATEGAAVNVVPEPGTLILLGAGLAGLAVWRRRHS